MPRVGIDPGDDSKGLLGVEPPTVTGSALACPARVVHQHGDDRTRPDVRGTAEARSLVRCLDEPPLHDVLIRATEMFRKRTAEIQPIG